MDGRRWSLSDGQRELNDILGLYYENKFDEALEKAGQFKATSLYHSIGFTLIKYITAVISQEKVCFNRFF